MPFPQNIFKAYDIRGLVDTELSSELSYALGRAFVVFLRSKGSDLAGKKLVIGRDMRASGVIFQKEVMHGIADEGVEVADIGLCTTPLFNFACAHYDGHAGGIIVTASHNPGEYNGFKLTLHNGLPVGGGTGLPDIRDLVIKNDFGPVAKRTGQIEKKDVLGDYLKKIFSLVPSEKIKPLKIVVDAGNGMGKVTVPDVLKKLPVEAEYLFLEPDGSFPNHEANPLKTETLEDLQAKVVELGADFGLALDGDCDRIGLVDEKGEIVDASFVGTLLGLEVLKKHPGSLMLYDLRSSMIIKEVWEAAGATTKMCRVGHAFIKKEMKESGASFASELSGHLYYHDVYDLECTDLSLLYFCQMLSESGKKLSELVAPLKKYWHSGEINFSAQGGPASGGKTFDKDGIIRKIEEKYRAEAEEISHLDGLWMSFNWGWFNVRPSNTEPVLRLTLEGKTKEQMEEKLSEVKNIINSF